MLKLELFLGIDATVKLSNFLFGMCSISVHMNQIEKEVSIWFL